MYFFLADTTRGNAFGIFVSHLKLIFFTARRSFLGLFDPFFHLYEGQCLVRCSVHPIFLETKKLNYGKNGP